MIRPFLTLRAVLATPAALDAASTGSFAERSGKAILLTGSHTWPNLVDMGSSDPPPAFDFDAYRKWLREHGHNFTRGWTWEPTKWDNTRMQNAEWRNGAHTVAPHPWPRTGPGLVLDGKPKFDLEKYNADCLDRIRVRLAKARDAGIDVSVMLFDGTIPRDSIRQAD